MSKEMDFFIYLLEHYAEKKQRTAPEILREWERCKLTELIYHMYEIYHVERLQNAFDDIDTLIEEAQTQATAFTTNTP